MENRIIPECYVDTVLIEILGYRKPNHKLNNSEVLKTLDSKGYNNSIGIGVIDKDKNQPKKLREEYSSYKKAGKLEILRKGDSKRFVIVHPNIERWTWEQGEQVGIDVQNYNLPKSYKAYLEICKKQNVGKNANIRNYLNALRNADTEIAYLKILIDTLIADHG